MMSDGVEGQGVKIWLPSLDFNMVKNHLAIFKVTWLTCKYIINTLFLYMEYVYYTTLAQEV